MIESIIIALAVVIAFMLPALVLIVATWPKPVTDDAVQEFVGDAPHIADNWK